MSYITKNDVYRIAGIPSDGSVVSDENINMHIEAAESIVEKELNTTFAIGGKTVTEVLDGNAKSSLALKYYPIISITSLSIDSVTITPSTLYVYNDTGVITLGPSSEANSFKNTFPKQITITYVYGEEPEEYIKQYTAAIAAQWTLVTQLGGTYASANSYTIPNLSLNKGDAAVKVMTTLEAVNKILEDMRTRNIIRAKVAVG